MSCGRCGVSAQSSQRWADPAELEPAAARDRADAAPLDPSQMSGVRLNVDFAMAAKDVGQFELPAEAPSPGNSGAKPCLLSSLASVPPLRLYRSVVAQGGRELRLCAVNRTPQPELSACNR